jgi:hypothetical protein
MARPAREHLGQNRSDGVDHAIHIERHGAVEAVEIDIANIERRIHAGAEQGEIDRPERALDLSTDVFSSSGLSTSAAKALMRSLDAASSSSFSLGRAVAAMATPDAASRRAISPQIAPDAPVIHATFQG